MVEQIQMQNILLNSYNYMNNTKLEKIESIDSKRKEKFFLLKKFGKFLFPTPAQGPQFLALALTFIFINIYYLAMSVGL